MNIAVGSTPNVHLIVHIIKMRRVAKRCCQRRGPTIAVDSSWRISLSLRIV